MNLTERDLRDSRIKAIYHNNDSYANMYIEMESGVQLAFRLFNEGYREILLEDAEYKSTPFAIFDTKFIKLENELIGQSIDLTKVVDIENYGYKEMLFVKDEVMYPKLVNGELQFTHKRKEIEVDEILCDLFMLAYEVSDKMIEEYKTKG